MICLALISGYLCKVPFPFDCELVGYGESEEVARHSLIGKALSNDLSDTALRRVEIALSGEDWRKG